jgi:hypothetical protein
MSVIDDINSQRDAALAILSTKLQAANDLKIGGASGMDQTINALVQQQADVAAQAYAKSLDDATTAQALAALKTATTQMSTVAAKMVSATTFISNVASLGTAAGKVVSALKA